MPLWPPVRRRGLGDSAGDLTSQGPAEHFPEVWRETEQPPNQSFAPLSTSDNGAASDGFLIATVGNQYSRSTILKPTSGFA
jgi:hypothetical protein